ncbi:autotransporter outer membrane beta-barrel domain-containing protein, partial [Serratia microhaemolytica]|uniref:autotransporter outer membrane beta-barrel domain-containing protein n=1 Tax=Serratia microhaemolytica TaxID=2675110 RepID=UPI000FDDCBC5
RSSSAFNFLYRLTGNGLLSVDTAGAAFNFAQSTGNAFSGEVQLNNSRFALSGANSAAVNNAKLTLNSGSITDVGQAGTLSDETVGNLTLNGGQLNFVGDIANGRADGVIQTDNFTANSGTVNIDGDFSQNNSDTSNLSLLDQNRGATGMTLANANSASGADNLTLRLNGVEVQPVQGVRSDITQNGITVAEGIYDYHLSNSSVSGQQGLYLNYQLHTLNLLADDANALLIASSSDPASNRRLTARLTGIGGIVFDGSAAPLTVANSSNDYRGSTTVRGQVLMGSDNAFGQSSRLTVQNGASLTSNGFNQSVGALTNAGQINLANSLFNSGLLSNSGVIDLAGGTLNLTEGGSSSADGGLTGSGTLNVQGGDLSITGANNGFTANTQIANGASISLSGSGNLGSSAVTINGALNFNAAGSFANLLSGAGVINTNAAVTLRGANHFSGTHNINQNGTLTVSEANHLGSSSAKVNLTDSQSQLVFSGLNGDVANQLQGVANSTITVNNAANMSLSADNSAFQGRFAINDNSALTVRSHLSLGSGSVDIAQGSNLNFALDNAGAATPAMLNSVSAISGNGTVNLANSAIRVTGTNLSAFTGLINIRDGSALFLNQDNLLNANATINVAAAEDALNINSSSAFNFYSRLLGAGVINVDTSNTDFNFGAQVGSQFSGTLNLSNSRFRLGGNNSQAMRQGNVKLSQGSVVEVEDGTQNIGALEMNGGTLVYNNLTENNAVVTSAGTIVADTIDTRGGGTVQVNLSPTLSPSLDGINTLDLDTGVQIVTLAKGAAQGTGNELVLTDEHGSPIGDTHLQGITNPNSNEVAAMGHFRYGLSTGAQQDGLYVNYGLQVLDLLLRGDRSLKLSGLAANNGTSSNRLTAQLIGSGDITIDSSDVNAVINLAGYQSSYTGATWVRSGTLQLGRDGALGNTSNLSLSAAGRVDLNGFSQTVGALNGALGSELDLSDGRLTVTGGGESASQLVGNGELILSGGTLTLHTDSQRYSGKTTIESAASAVLTQAKALGYGKIDLAGQLVLKGITGNLVNALQGNGAVSVTDKAKVILTGDNSAFRGNFVTQTDSQLTATRAENFGQATVTNNGVLALDVVEDFWQLNTAISGSGSILKLGHGTLQISNSAVSAANTVVEDGKLLLGTAPVQAANKKASKSATPAGSHSVLNSNMVVQANGTFGGDGQLMGNLTNRGTILVGRSATGFDYSNLTINGNYVGDGGLLVFDAMLGGDNSPTDRLIINGNTSGKSWVKVNNIGGKGAKTVNGIQIIRVSGDSAGKFSLKGRAVAGALEYYLYRGTSANPNDGNWYLRSEAEIDYRPESGSYIANIAAAKRLFNNRLHDINTHVVNDISDKESSVWLRQVGGRNKFTDSSGQISSTSERYVAQLGGEVLQARLMEQDRLAIGVVAGYGNSNGDSEAKKSHYSSGQSLNGYNLGIYATWYLNASERHSPYLHGWVHYDWFKASVNGQELAGERYRIDGIAASIESGYPLPLYRSHKHRGYLVPQLQLTYNGAKMGTHTESNGTVIEQVGRDNLQTRVGITLANDSEAKNGEVLKTYLDINYLYNSNPSGVTMDGMRVMEDGKRNLFELKFGLEGQLNQSVSIWGNIGQQFGEKGYDDKSAMLGVRYKF